MHVSHVIFTTFYLDERLTAAQSANFSRCQRLVSTNARCVRVCILHACVCIYMSMQLALCSRPLLYAACGRNDICFQLTYFTVRILFVKKKVTYFPCYFAY